MDSLFQDEARIKFFAQIQADLANLEVNSSDEDIDSIISKIPQSYLDSKDDLKIIFSIFAYYGRNNVRTMQRITIKLFEKIMIYVKKNLQNESAFIWNSFGSLFYFHHWMYEEGLISINEIVQQMNLDNTFSVVEYFLPELFEKVPEIFEKEIKKKLKRPFSIEYINEFRELRKKHFKWLKESNDFNDPIYREIEKNPLRLAIKTDDIDTFQSIISSSNTPIDSMIQESILENCYFRPHPISLIDFAIDFNAIKIFKYLYMNGAKFDVQSIFNSICSRNYEMIHIIESKDESEFKKYSLLHSIMCNNHEVTLYAIENYNYDFLEKENAEIEDTEFVLKIVFHFCYSVNFRFFDSIFLPFLRKNPLSVANNINEILIYAMKDYSCFFLKEFFKYPGINVNYCSKYDLNKNDSLLNHALRCRNNDIIEILLNNPNILLDYLFENNLFPFHFACAIHADMKIIEMFCNHPKFDINLKEKYRNMTAFCVGAIKGNFFVLDFILQKYPNYFESFFVLKQLIVLNITNKSEMTVKLLFKLFAKEKDKDVSDEELIEDIKRSMILTTDYVNVLRQIQKELSS